MMTSPSGCGTWQPAPAPEPSKGMRVVYCVQALPDGNVVSGSDDRTIKVWDTGRGLCLKTMAGHTGAVTCMQQLPDQKLVSGSWDKTIKVWDLRSGECLKTLSTGDDELGYMCLLPNGHVVAGGFWYTSESAAKIWDLDSGKCVRSLPEDMRVAYAQVLQTGELVTGDYYGRIMICDSRAWLLNE